MSDRREVCTIAQLQPGQSACVRAMVAAPPTLSRIRKGLELVKFRAVDETGALDITYFNQAYRKNEFHEGQTYVFFGRAEGNLLRRQMNNPAAEPEGKGEVTGRIVPVYPLTAGVSQTLLRRAVTQGLSACSELLPDPLPDELRLAQGLCRVEYAYQNIHFPADEQALTIARRRRVFEELFLLSLALGRLRSRRNGDRAPPVGKRPGPDALFGGPALFPDGGPAPLRGRGTGGYALRPAHEPPVSGRRGLRQDHGGGGLRLLHGQKPAARRP